MLGAEEDALDWGTLGSQSDDLVVGEEACVEDVERDRVAIAGGS